ncbi:MAG: sensor histidine kinase [Longimicrobiales bacterium]|nr:sensor histidine kinase [Longimicrobiales bacterium]
MKKPPTLQRAGPSQGRTAQEGGLPGVVRAFLQVPLFWKIVLANGALLALVGGITAIALSGPGNHEVSGSALAVLLLGTLLAATVVNAWIVALALRPLDRITETAEAVRLGDVSARTRTPSYADRRLEHLGWTLNEMLEALAAARERQKELSHQVLRAEERERERIASEIYAGTAQTLAGVLVRLRIILRRMEEDDRGHLEEVTGEIRSALEEVRAFARRLRPPELDELGVRAALEAHARGLANGQAPSPGPGPEITFEGELEEDRLDGDARLALFRVVQEALTNAVRHSGASRVSVAFRPRGEGLEALVSDDGRGFEPEALYHDPPARLGLFNMIERAGYAQGSVQVDSSPGHGTRVRVHLPWHRGSTEGDPALLAGLVAGLARATPEPPGSA